MNELINAEAKGLHQANGKGLSSGSPRKDIQFITPTDRHMIQC